MAPRPATVRVLLGGDLRHHPGARGGELDAALETPVAARVLLARLGIAPERARILLLNHRGAGLDTVVRPGDRLAVFPPDLAFNLFVALELAHGGNGERNSGET
jgi:molybdopterin converting factor small subunit